MKTFKQFLSEAKQVGTIYHFTDPISAIGILNSDTLSSWGSKVTSRESILHHNKLGLLHPDSFWFFYTPIHQLAYELGTKQIDLSKQNDVTGFRYGKSPESGISHNYRDDVSEKGLSLSHLKNEPQLPVQFGFQIEKNIK